MPGFSSQQPVIFDQRDPRRRSRQDEISTALMRQGSSTAPVQSGLEGLARALTGVTGGFIAKQTQDKDRAEIAAQNKALAELLAGGGQTMADPGVSGPARGIFAGAQGDANNRTSTLASLLDSNPGLRPFAEQSAAAQQFPELFPEQAPKTRTIKRGDREITQEFRNGQFVDIAEAPLFKPDVLSPEAEEQKLRLAREGRAQTNITTTVQNKQLGKEAETVGGFFGDMFVQSQKGEQESRGRADKIGRLDSLLDQVYTGAGADAVLAAKKAAAALGVDVDVDAIGAAEAGKALASEMALQLRNPAGGAGMPGAMSDKDREFLQSMTPGLATTKAGRKRMKQAADAIAKRDREVAKMARDYRRQNGSLDEGFMQQVSEFAEANPLFPESAAGSGRFTALSADELGAIDPSSLSADELDAYIAALEGALNGR